MVERLCPQLAEGGGHVGKQGRGPNMRRRHSIAGAALSQCWVLVTHAEQARVHHKCPRVQGRLWVPTIPLPPAEERRMRVPPVGRLWEAEKGRLRLPPPAEAKRVRPEEALRQVVYCGLLCLQDVAPLQAPRACASGLPRKYTVALSAKTHSGALQAA